VDADTHVLVEFPARPEFLRLARLAAADLGSRAGFDYEEIEDLRIAVSELCAMISAEHDAAVSLSFALSRDSVRVEGSSPYPGSMLLADDLELARGLVAAVVDEHDVSTDGGVARFSLLKRRHV
jgi:serine/threonine-protein kinase RsbW